MAIQHEGIPMIQSGNQVIAFMGQKDINRYFQGYMDNASLHSWYQEDPLNNHLGLMKFWNQQSPNQSKTIYEDLLSQKATLEVNGWDGAFTYDVPIEETKGCFTTADLSHQLYGGIDGSIFYIELNREYNPGTTLTYDAFDGQQIVVAEEEEVENTGTGYKHPVKLVTNDKNEYYLSYKLGKGISYFEVGHGVSEFGDKFAKISMPEKVGTATLEFRLGSPRGVEAWFTGQADSKNLGGAVASSKEYLNAIRGEMDECGLEEFAVRMDLGSNGKPVLKTANIGSTIEYLVHKKLNMLTASQILFQRAGTVRSTNGIIRYNEGLWHQLRRGFIIRYGKPGGVQISHLKEAAEYIFRANPDLAYEDRRLKFKCGTLIFENMLDLFQEEIMRQAEYRKFAPFAGADRQIPSNVEGKNLKELSWKPIRFTSVYIPQLGQIEIERDSSLDYGMMQDRFSAGFHGNQKSHTAYSMIIWDAANPFYSNNTQDIPKGTSVPEGANKNANIYLVKPEGALTYSGMINGRYDMRKSSDIVASHKTIAQEFWAYNNVSVWVKDPSRFVMIELAKPEIKGFN